MTRLWILRDPNDVVIACAPEDRGPYYVLPAVEYDTRHEDAMRDMRKSIDLFAFAGSHTARGYTLALEPHPTPEAPDA